MIGHLVEKTFRVANKLPKPMQNVMLSQQQTLKKLLDTAQRTAFGKEYSFTRTLNSKDYTQAFRDTVPIFDYNDLFDQWWHRLLDSEPDICWPGRVRNFALSSGTSGAPSKYIPVTSDMQRSMRRAGLRLFMSLPRFGIDPNQYAKPMLMIGSSSSLIRQKDYYIGDLSGINSNSPPFWIRGYYKPGTEISKTRDWNQRTAIIVENAPKWDIGFISGIPSWVLMTLTAIMEHYNLQSIHEIWPHLKVFVSGGIKFQPYLSAYQKIFSRDVTVIDSYLASEGFIAFQNRPNTHGMQLVFDGGLFYEFVPFNDTTYDDMGKIKTATRSLLINEVEEGVDYSLVISSNSGAWRYQIGDLVRFTNLENKEIVISGRTSHFLSVTGEHVSVSNMSDAVIALQDEFGTNVKEFTVSPIKSGKLFAHKWFIGADKHIDAGMAARILDDSLKSLNDDYATERRENALDMPQVEIIPNNWFYTYMEMKGKLNGQAKFPRVLKPEQFEDWTAFIAARKNQSAY